MKRYWLALLLCLATAGCFEGNYGGAGGSGGSGGETNPPPIEQPSNEVPVTGYRLRVMIIRSADLADMAALPNSQILIFSSTKIANWVKANDVEFRVWDDAADVTYASPELKAVYAKPRGELPWTWVSNGKTGTGAELPLDEDAAIAFWSTYLP